MIITPCPECHCNNRIEKEPDEKYKKDMGDFYGKATGIFVYCPDCGTVGYIHEQGGFGCFE